MCLLSGGPCEVCRVCVRVCNAELGAPSPLPEERKTCLVFGMKQMGTCLRYRVLVFRRPETPWRVGVSVFLLRNQRWELER